MKITSSSNITSIRLTTLICELSASSRRRGRAILDAAFPYQQRYHRRAEPLEQVVEPVEPVGEDVVAERGGNGDAERSRGSHERFGDAGRHRRKVSRAGGGDADEG